MWPNGQDTDYADLNGFFIIISELDRRLYSMKTINNIYSIISIYDLLWKSLWFSTKLNKKTKKYKLQKKERNLYIVFFRKGFLI